MEYWGPNPQEIIDSAAGDAERGYLKTARGKLQTWLFWNRRLPSRAKADVVLAYREMRVREWNARKTPKAKGCDRYGLFFDLSGNEWEGHCFLCGAETKGRYCCEEHSDEYWNTYNWKWASFECYKRFDVEGGYRCGDCGYVGKYSEFEAHHVIPLGGEERNWNVLNMPGNLILLCRKCHVKRHVEWNYLMRQKEAKLKVDVNDGQLTLNFMDSCFRGGH